MSFDAQAIQYYQSQFTFPAGQLGKKSKAIEDAVPRDTHAFFLHLEFKY